MALRLIKLGYTRVCWMRDGITGWIRHDLPLAYVVT